MGMRTALLFALLAPAAFGQSLAQIYDGQVTMIEREVYALAERMPADKYNFAPKTGNPPGAMFDGVRNFGAQVKHIATVMYQLSSSVLGEQPPVQTGEGEEGPASVQTKEQILEYFRGAIAFAHKAAQSITPQTSMQQVGSVAFMGLHSFDHYGQMVVYARMNGVIPGPAPAPGQGKAKGR